MMKINTLILVGATVILGMIFVTINPQTLPSIALFGVFGLIYIIISQAVTLLLLVFKKLLGLKWRTSTIRRVGFSLALLPTFLLLLQSVGQLTVRDSALAITLTVLLYVYLHRMFGGTARTDV